MDEINAWNGIVLLASYSHFRDWYMVSNGKMVRETGHSESEIISELFRTRGLLRERIASLMTP